MNFFDDEYLLCNKKAKLIYEEIKELPIIDPHNHSDLEEIIKNDNWSDIWEAEGKTDHYIWQLMRRMGVSEERITGSASNYEKWSAFANVFPDLVLNPVFDWLQLDLKNIFGIRNVLNGENSKEIWDITKTKLAENKNKPQQLLKKMKVEIMCTTDDPVSDLKYHKLAHDNLAGIKVFPTWRPDKYSKIDSNNWVNNIKGIIKKYLKTDNISFDKLLKSLELSHDYFDSLGCVASDHDLPSITTKDISYSKTNIIFDKAINEKNYDITKQDILDFKAFMLNYYADLNSNKDWIMQLHIGVVRNYRKSLEDNIGINSGGDIIGSNLDLVNGLKFLLNNNESLRMIAYVINHNYLPSIVSIARTFPNFNLGSSWWYNDSNYGMGFHLDFISSLDILSKQTGMVSDSRKIMSYGSRNEMYRRTLANLLGREVSKQRLPLRLAINLASKLSYQRPLDLFFNKNNI